jgi:23S rRNA (cytosine1962-C5)-methyltransferase
LWVRLLKERLAPRAIIERNDAAVRKLEGLSEQKGVLDGTTDGIVQVRVGRAEFVCNLFDPHKTGLYLDQQESYERVGSMVRSGMRVLDVFCHQAGFAIHALLAGAAEAIAVDSSEASLSLARQSAELSGVGQRLQWVCDNAFDVLRKYQQAKRQFDLVILDPPSFTRSRSAVAEARRGYKEIHVRALRLLTPGGCLATFCCSHHVSTELFQDIILEAARDVGVILRRDMVLAAAADHPVLPALPETEYLKGYVLTIVDQVTPVRRSHGPSASRKIG